MSPIVAQQTPIQPVMVPSCVLHLFRCFMPVLRWRPSKGQEKVLERPMELATAVDACRYLGALIVGALNGVEKEELLSDHYTPIPGYWAEKTIGQRD